MGRLDFVVGRLTSVDERDRLKQEVLLNEPVALVVGADHPLAGRKELDFAELVEQDWVFPHLRASAMVRSATCSARTVSPARGDMWRACPIC